MWSAIITDTMLGIVPIHLAETEGVTAGDNLMKMT